MADEKTGSEKAKTPNIVLNWDFRFWDIREGSPLEGFRLLKQKGYGYLAGKGGHIAKVVLEYADTGDPVLPDPLKAKFKTDTDIGRLTFDPGQRSADALKADPASDGLTLVNLKLDVHPNHQSGMAAHPHLDSPKADAKWNSTRELQMRSLVFSDLAIDENGCFAFRGLRETESETFDLWPCDVSDSEAARGIPPHGYIKIFESTFDSRKKVFSQRIDIDWKFDVIRPLKQGWLDDKTADRPTPLDEMYLVIHCTTMVPEEKREAVNERNREFNEAHRTEIANETRKAKKIFSKSSTYIGSQIATLTGQASIHYLVDIDGHVVKILEETRAARHAGWQFKRGDPANSFVPRWRTIASGNARCIGIEHVAAPDHPWPEAQVTGSKRIIKDVMDHFGILPCDVVRHGDLAARQSTRVHENGKPCPGSSVPWGEYQDAGLTLWPLGVRAGEVEPTVPEGPGAFYRGVFDLLTFMDDALEPAQDTPANQAIVRGAIEDLQADIRRIGYWCINRTGSNLGTYDAATRYAVTKCQERFMILRGNSADVADIGRTDRTTATVIFRVCAHGEDILPNLAP